MYRLSRYRNGGRWLSFDGRLKEKVRFLDRRLEKGSFRFPIIWKAQARGTALSCRSVDPVYTFRRLAAGTATDRGTGRLTRRVSPRETGLSSEKTRRRRKSVIFDNFPAEISYFEARRKGIANAEKT